MNIKSKSFQEGGKYLLEDLQDLGVDVIKLLDPTGITSWKDAYTAVKAIDKKNPESFLNAGIEVIGALPVVGKAAKLGKIGKLVRKTEKLLSKNKNLGLATRIAKVPGKLVHNTISTPMKLVDKQFPYKLNNARNFIKGSYVASDIDDVVSGGSVKKGLAYKIGGQSEGVANILALPISYLSPVNYKYSGYMKANDAHRKEVKGYPDALKQVIYGNGNFKPYTKEKLYLDGKKLENTVIGDIYPSDTIIANKNLKGRNIELSSDNLLKTKIDTPIIDTKHFRTRFMDNKARSIDIWDFAKNTLSGRLMNSAAQPSWKYPKAGKITIVDETPVKYAEESDDLLKLLMKKDNSNR